MTGPMRAVHGGAFFDALGEDFAHLERRADIVNADVLDAWYDPSPRVMAALQEHLPWLIKTSPPTHGDGLRRVIAEHRGIASDQIVLGAGSSTLMFSAFPRLLQRGEDAVILDPMYGEYAHIVENLIGGTCRRFLLPESHFMPDIDALADFSAASRLVILVNPNSPTGVGLTRKDMGGLLNKLPPETRLWVDETYIDFMPGSESVEPLTRDFDNLIVSKSMSKFYALSGLRIGYLACSSSLVTQLSEQNPPWAVGMLAQLAAVEALNDPGYYLERARETHQLRTDLAADLDGIPGLATIPSTTNFLLMKFAEPLAEQVVLTAQKQGVFLRNCDSLSPRFQGRYIRTAVKSASENAKIAAAVRSAI